MFVLKTATAIFSYPTVGPPLIVGRLNSKRDVIRVSRRGGFLLLPMRRTSPRTGLCVVTSGSIIHGVGMHLTIGGMSCFIPISLAKFSGGRLSFGFRLVPSSTVY